MFLQTPRQEASTLDLNEPIQPLTLVRKLKLNLYLIPNQDYFVKLQRFLPNLADITITVTDQHIPPVAEMFAQVFPRLETHRILSIFDGDNMFLGPTYQTQINNLRIVVCLS